MSKRTSDRLSEYMLDPERVGKFDQRIVLTTFIPSDPKSVFSHEFDAIEWPCQVYHLCSLLSCSRAPLPLKPL